MRPALGPLGTPVLPYLEAHFSRLPLTSGCNYPHLPHSHFDEELIIVVKGTARFFFSERVTEQVVQPGGSRKYRPAKPSARLLRYNAPRGTILLHPAQNNHTVSSVDGEAVEYICIRLVRARTLAALLNQHDAGLVPGQFNRTRILTPSAETLAAWHDGGSGSAAAPVAPRAAAVVGLRRGAARKEVLFEEPVADGEEQLEVHATVTDPGGGYRQHTDAHDVLLLILCGSVRVPPSEQVLGPNSVVLLPAGSRHGLLNMGSVPSVHYAFEFRKGHVATETVRKTAVRRKRAGARDLAAAKGRGGQTGPPTAAAAAWGGISVRRRMKTTAPGNRPGLSPRWPRDMNKVGALGIVGICTLQCNTSRLADWVRLLRAPGHGAWDGGVAIVVDRTNVRAVASLRLNALLVLPPLSWVVWAFNRDSIGKPSALAGRLHMHAAVLKTHLLEMEQLRGFKALIYVDIDCAAVSSVREALEAPGGVLDAVVDLGMPADTTDARSSAVIVMRRTRVSSAFVLAWREQMARNLDEFFKAPANASRGKRCGRRVYTSWHFSGHPCFKDQQALNQILEQARGSVALIPQLVLQWTAALERGQLPLQKLLEEPSSRKDALGRMHAASDGPTLEFPCFVHFSRWERNKLATPNATINILAKPNATIVK